MLKEVGVNVTIVPFKSGGESVTNVIAGNVQATSEASIVVIPQIRGGKLKAIATTYDKITAAPEIPTTKEQGFPNVRIGHWAGLFAPRGTPDAIIERMNRELLAAVKSKDFHDKMVPQGIEPAPFTLAEYRDFMKHERERLGEIAQRSHMTVE
jgi:tripartite-type tricarboxylate transporter receptor subunit TctC